MPNPRTQIRLRPLNSSLNPNRTTNSSPDCRCEEPRTPRWHPTTMTTRWFHSQSETTTRLWCTRREATVRITTRPRLQAFSTLRLLAKPAITRVTAMPNSWSTSSQAREIRATPPHRSLKSSPRAAQCSLRARAKVSRQTPRSPPSSISTLRTTKRGRLSRKNRGLSAAKSAMDNQSNQTSSMKKDKSPLKNKSPHLQKLPKLAMWFHKALQPRKWPPNKSLQLPNTMATLVAMTKTMILMSQIPSRWDKSLKAKSIKSWLCLKRQLKLQLLLWLTQLRKKLKPLSLQLQSNKLRYSRVWDQTLRLGVWLRPLTMRCESSKLLSKTWISLNAWWRCTLPITTQLHPRPVSSIESEGSSVREPLAKCLWLCIKWANSW